MRLTSQVPERRLLRIKGRARAGGESPIPGNLPGGPRSAQADWAHDTDLCNDANREEERRKSRRITKKSDVIIRRVGGVNLTVQMHNISNGGCKIELADPYVVGDPAITRLPKLEPLGSRICWVNGTTAGVQFLTTIYPAVFNALLERLPDLEAA